jgi:hypothetical protein
LGSNIRVNRDRAAVIVPVSAQVPARRVIEFGARKRKLEVIRATNNEHFSVGQQRRPVKLTSIVQAAGGAPLSSYRIVEFHARDLLALKVDEIVAASHRAPFR